MPMDFGTPFATPQRVFVECELETCEEQQVGIWSTCRKHTDLLKKHKPAALRYIMSPIYFNNDYGEDHYVTDTEFDFRFSASYAKRYNNCHASANLEEAIPGYVAPPRNEDGMKGEGSRLHKIFEEVLSSGVMLSDAATLLREMSEVWGHNRTKLIEDRQAYIIWWFTAHKSAPPISWEVINEGMQGRMVNKAGKQVLQPVAPLKYKLMADALDYIQKLLDRLEDTEIIVEKKMTAEWLQTKPKTTPDILLVDRKSKTLMALDLKMGDIKVEAFMNEQLMYYLKTYGVEGFDTLEVHIMQRNNFQSWEVPHTVLERWAQEILDSEQAIINKDLTFNVGSHCEFCPANPQGRGDKGSMFCGAKLSELYGARDKAESEAAVLEGDIDDI